MARESLPYAFIIAIVALVLLAFLYNPLDQMVGAVTGTSIWMSGSTEAQNSMGWMLDLWVYGPIVLLIGFMFKLWQVSKEGVGR